MNDPVKRELRVLSVVFGVIFAIALCIYVVHVWDSQLRVTPLKVSPLQKSTLPLSSVQNLKQVSLVEAGCSMHILSPKNQSDIASKAVEWLKEAEPVSVKLPKLSDNVSSSCGGSFSRLNLQMNNGNVLNIFPTNYEKRDRNGYTIHYVNNVIEVNENGHNTYYFRSKNLYNYLQSGGWKQDFIKQ